MQLNRSAQCSQPSIACDAVAGGYMVICQVCTPSVLFTPVLLVLGYGLLSRCGLGSGVEADVFCFLGLASLECYVLQVH